MHIAIRRDDRPCAIFDLHRRPAKRTSIEHAEVFTVVETCDWRNALRPDKPACIPRWRRSEYSCIEKLCPSGYGKESVVGADNCGDR